MAAKQSVTPSTRPSVIFMRQQVERAFSFVGWLLQLLLAYIGPSAALMVAASVASIDSTYAWPWWVFNYAAVAVLAAVTALGVSALFPGLAIQGRWVWVLPVIFEISSLVFDLHSQPSEVPLFFCVPSSMDGEAGLVVVLLTVPTWGCCWYSAVMWWRGRRRESAVSLKG